VIDWLIVTSANRQQGRAYLSELRSRRIEGVGRVSVVPDPGGRRVGSGLSTFLVLARVARRLVREGARGVASAFAGRRVLILHCGGDSRRLPAYAAHGKLFLPLPVPTAPTTMFDMILDDVRRLTLPAGRVVIATGDVMLGIGRHPIALDGAGCVGVAYPDRYERARGHGVYVRGRVGETRGGVWRAEVGAMLQKPPMEEARTAGAVLPDGRLLVDTGVVSIDGETAARWLEHAGVRMAGGGVQIADGLLGDSLRGRAGVVDLYGDVLPGDLPGAGFAVEVAPDCEFFHVGTTRELLRIAADGALRARLGFGRRVRARVAEESALGGGVVLNSKLDGRSSLGPGSYVEGVEASCDVELGEASVLVGLPREARRPIRVSPELGLVCLPVRENGRRSWSALAFGVDDDFKTPMGSGGTFANRPLEELLTACRPEEIWDRGAPGTLWDARLWRTGELDGVLGSTAWMYTGERSPPEGWRSSRRVSAATLMRMVDHGRLVAHRESIMACLRGV